MNFHYWFYNNEHGPRCGVIIMEDRVIDLDFTNREDLKKLDGLPTSQIIGGGTLVPAKGMWHGEFVGPRGSTVYPPEGRSTAEEFVAYLREYRDKAFADERTIQADPVALLERAMRECDWYSHFSDDYNVCVRGERQYAELKSLMTKVPVQVARELFAKHAPKDFKCPI